MLPDPLCRFGGIGGGFSEEVEAQHPGGVAIPPGSACPRTRHPYCVSSCTSKHGDIPWSRVCTIPASPFSQRLLQTGSELLGREI